MGTFLYFLYNIYWVYLFQFCVKVQGTKLHNLVTVFQKIDATDAISVIDEMIARRIDEEI